MYRKNTVFVLGAGASWHYGYPTGEQLVAEMVSAADKLDLFLQAARTYGQIGEPTFIHHLRTQRDALATPQDAIDHVRGQIADFKGRVRATDPLVIDYFLGHNPHLADLGRLLIAYVLYARESATTRLGKNVNRTKGDGKDNWIRFVTARLTSGCSNPADLLENQVRFVTFNYDLSLERELYAGLSGLSYFPSAEVERFLGEGRILHVYGSLSGSVRERTAIDFGPMDRIPWPGSDPAQLVRDGTSARHILDAAWESGKALKVIDPIHKEEDDDRLAQATKAVLEADCVYVLGYGFDLNNTRRIGLDQMRHSDRPSRAVLFTNYENSNRISKIAGNIFLLNHSAFIERPMRGVPSTPSYFEMSIKNVYDALSLDFDDL